MNDDLNLWLPARNVRIDPVGDGLSIAQSADEPMWWRDESDGYPQYILIGNPVIGEESVESVYIQPGGCVELRIDGEDEGWMWHICDFPKFVAMMNDLLRVWRDHPERY